MSGEAQTLTRYAQVAADCWTPTQYERAQAYKQYLTHEFITEFGLGVAPRLDQLEDAGLTEQELIDVGLLKTVLGKARRHFWDHIILPCASNNQVQYTIGRAFSPTVKPKLLNLPCPPRGVARPPACNVDVLVDEAILHNIGLLLVEGHLDALCCTRLGHPSVGMMGTNPSPDLVTKARRLMAEGISIYLMLDGTADVDVAKRTLTASRIGPLTWVCELPKGCDPDDLSGEQIALVKRNSHRAWTGVIAGLCNGRRDYANCRPSWAHHHLPEIVPQWRSALGGMELQCLDGDLRHALSMGQGEYREYVTDLATRRAAK